MVKETRKVFGVEDIVAFRLGHDKYNWDINLVRQLVEPDDLDG